MSFLSCSKSYLEPIFRTFHLNVEIINTTSLEARHSSSQIPYSQGANALGVSLVSGLYTSFSWHKSCL